MSRHSSGLQCFGHSALHNKVSAQSSSSRSAMCSRARVVNSVAIGTFLHVRAIVAAAFRASVIAEPIAGANSHPAFRLADGFLHSLRRGHSGWLSLSSVVRAPGDALRFSFSFCPPSGNRRPCLFGCSRLGRARPGFSAEPAERDRRWIFSGHRCCSVFRPQSPCPSSFRPTLFP